MQKTPYVFPIIGGRKVENLKANLDVLDIALSNDQIKELESVIPFDVGFLTTLIGDNFHDGGDGDGEVSENAISQCIEALIDSHFCCGVSI